MSMKRGSAVHRLKIIKGHLGKVINMVEQEEDCINTLQQLEAVMSALKKTEQILIEKYLNECLKKNIKNTPKGAALQKELMNLFKRY